MKKKQTLGGQIAIIFAINRKRDPKRTRKLVMAAACFFLRIFSKKIFLKSASASDFCVAERNLIKNLMKKVKQSIKAAVLCRYS